MARRFLLPAVLLTLALHAQVVDRMVAVANKRVVLQSELEQAVRVEFLLKGKPLSEVTTADLETSLDHLIDQSLLDQQMADSSIADPTPEELAAELKSVRSQIPGASSDDSWKALLASYGLTVQDVEMSLAEQMRLLKLTDLRFRAMVRVGRNAIATYYQETLIPELRKNNAPEPPLEQVSPQIEKILTEQRITELLNQWLEALRAQSHIEKMLPLENTLGGGKHS